MSHSRLNLTSLAFDISGDDVTLTASLNTLTLAGTSGVAVQLVNVANLQLTETGGGTDKITLSSPSSVTTPYTITFPPAQGVQGQVLELDGSGLLQWANNSGGDVVGPGSSTDNAIVRFDGITGKLIQNSVNIIDDSGKFTIDQTDTTFTPAVNTGGTMQINNVTLTDDVTAGSGTATAANFVSFLQPTLAATNSSVTTTDAATLYIENSPVAGTNQTITNPWALWIDNGNVRVDGNIQHAALFSGASIDITGTCAAVTHKTKGVTNPIEINGNDIINLETITFRETGGDTTETTTISAPATITANYTMFLPGTQGTADTVLSNDGSGNTSWSNPSTIYSFTDVNTATYNILVTDHYIGVSYSTTGTSTLTLPLIATSGKVVYEIIDTGGMAGTNNITVDTTGGDTISGDSNIIISENYNAVSLTNDNSSSWYIF